MEEIIREFINKKEADQYMNFLNQYKIDYLLDFESDDCEDYPMEDEELHIKKYIVTII